MKKEIKVKKVKFIINNPVFSQDITFSFGESCEDLYKYIKRRVGDIQGIEDIKWGKDSNIGRCIQLSNGVLIVRMRKFPDTASDYGILAHEIFHSVEFMLNRVGVEYDIDKSSEVYAYNIEHLTREVYLQLGKYL